MKISQNPTKILAAFGLHNLIHIFWKSQTHKGSILGVIYIVEGYLGGILGIIVDALFGGLCLGMVLPA